MKLPLSQQVRVVIVDDQPAIRKDAAALIQQQPGFIVVGTAGSVQEALELIPSVGPDLLLLDISLGDGTGFDLLEQISPLTFRIIFLTAHEEHAIKAIKFGALDYLLKPLDENELQQALAKVTEAIPTNNEQLTITNQYLKQESKTTRLVLRSKEYLHVVELDEIIYCNSNVGCTTFFLTDNRKITASRHLKEYEDMLPPSAFLRPHQSYLVNSRFIYKFHKDGFLELKDKTKIPVATRRRDFVKQYINRFK